MNKIRKIIAVVFLGLSFLLVVPNPVPVYAGGNGEIGLCTFLPQALCETFGLGSGAEASANAGTVVRRWIDLGVTVLFAAIVIIAVYVIVTNAVKYIQSQGEEGKIQEATKAIKSVFIGIALLFVGIVGLVLVLAFFGGSGLLDQGVDCEDQCGTENTECIKACEALTKSTTNK